MNIAVSQKMCGLRLSISSILLVVLSLYGISLAEPAFSKNICDVTSSINQAVTDNPVEGSAVNEWSTYQQKISAAIGASAEQIKNLYFARKWQKPESDALRTCLDADTIRRLSHSLQDSFFRSSLQHLTQSRGRKSKLSGLVSSGHFEMFRLVGHIKPEPGDIGDGSGGFHRGRRSIFMDFTKIDPDDWLLIFSHEMVHSVDSVLKNAVDVFSSLALSKKVNQLSRDFSDPETLNGDDRIALNKWLVAAYDRGFFAEVRTWAVSFAIYQEGRKDGTIASLPWMETILKQKRQDESIQDFATRFLDPNFFDPKGKPFESPLVQKEIKILREQIRTGKRKILIGPELSELL